VGTVPAKPSGVSAGVPDRLRQVHILQHAGQAVDEVRRAEFFRQGGAARDLVRGKRWLLLTSWLNLDRNKQRQLNALPSTTQE
jgi:hypothetical protein